jgi:hypothetical protein
LLEVPGVSVAIMHTESGVSFPPSSSCLSADGWKVLTHLPLLLLVVFRVAR